MRLTTSFLYHTHAVDSRNKWFTSCGTCGVDTPPTYLIKIDNTVESRTNAIVFAPVIEWIKSCLTYDKNWISLARGILQFEAMLKLYTLGLKLT